MAQIDASPNDAMQSEFQIDPVCGMKVLPEKAAGFAEHGGKIWYFCGKGCLAKFVAEPRMYDGAAAMSFGSVTILRMRCGCGVLGSNGLTILYKCLMRPYAGRAALRAFWTLRVRLGDFEVMGSA